jgi:muramoyltetrapeptide carboxypeptidase
MSQPLKPHALRPGDAIRIVSLASPVDEAKLDRGCAEIEHLGYVPRVDRDDVLARDSFFAGPTSRRALALKQAFAEPDTRAIFCARGGYGSNYLLPDLSVAEAPAPKILLGYSDLTSLQLFLWQKLRWVTLYGPMIAAGFDEGAAGGYDRNSFCAAVSESAAVWPIDLQGETLTPGGAEGILLGGCLTLVETALGTPWELDTTDAILVLEDRGMKPYQVDRVLMHLKQAGKFRAVRGIILGEFPECHAPDGGESVRDVASRILAPDGHGRGHMPVVFGAAIGHTARPMLTLPLGVRARLTASAAAGGKSCGQLDILEPAVV